MTKAKNELSTIIEETKNNIQEVQAVRVPESMDGERNMIQDLTMPAKAMYCSLIPGDRKESVMLFNATNEPDSTISDQVGETLLIKHIFAEEITLNDQVTGEQKVCPRIVFIDVNDKSYSCVSIGMYSALRKVFATFGFPKDWEEPLAIKIKNKTIGKNKMLTFIVQ